MYSFSEYIYIYISDFITKITVLQMVMANTFLQNDAVV